MKPALSLTTRLAALFAAMTSGLLIIVGIAVDRAVSAHFDELDLHDLSAKQMTIETLIASTTSEQALAHLPSRLNDALAGHQTIALRLSIPRYDWRYAVLDDRFEHPPQSLASNASGLIRWRDAHGTLHIGQAIEMRLPLPDPASVEVLLGLDISHHEHFLNSMRLQLGLGISAAALLAALLGWLLARKGLAPIHRVTRTASRLSAERLGERLSENDAPPEMRALVEAFNGMLDRLETSFRRLNEFSADIAHELRTPVSNLMTETQVALSRSRSAEEYRETLHSNLEEFERLARMIADMLFLAKADNGLLPQPAETVELQTEAGALVEFYEALAEEKRIQIRLSGTGQVIGDRLMLRRALSNLLSNAIRHTPQNETIDIRIRHHQGQVLLEVTNPGPPVPPDQLPLLFERFHRVDRSRTRQSDGSGLGLSITRSIVEAHQGSVDVKSDAGGTTFTITLGNAQD